MTPSSIQTLINAQDINAISPDVLLLEMKIEVKVNDHARCYMKFRQTPDLPFDHKDFIVGTHDVKAILPDGSTSLLFQGLIRNATVKYEPSGSFILEIHSTNFTADLDQFNTFFTYANSLDLQSKINKMIEITKAGELKAAVATENTPPGDLICPRFYQLGETCWRHLLADASDLGVMLVSGLDTLMVLDTFIDSGTQLGWRVEGGLTAFEVDANMQNGNRSGVNYDVTESKSRIFPSVLGDKPKTLGSMPELADAMFSQATAPAALGGRPFVSMTAEASAELDLKLDSQQAVVRTVIGRGQCTDPTISPGFSLQITGNPLFAGKWGLIEVVHHWRNAGYDNEFTGIPFDAPVRPEPGQLPPMTLPVRGRIASAPANSDRLQVQMPWEEDTSASLFWPWLSPYTGAGRGICYPPEIGDEVLVQFVNGEGKDAYIVSGAWNGVDRAPLEKLFGDERNDNDIKRIATKSGNRLVMDDKEGKETIVMATPKHVRVSLFDGGSTLVMHSDGDIHISAGGTVHMKCAQFLREVG